MGSSLNLIRDARNVALLCVGLLIAILVIAHPVSSRASQKPAPVTMMIVGDSITAGQAGDYTWRFWFYQQERAAGVDLSLAGPYSGLATIKPDPPPAELGSTLPSPRYDNHDYADPDFGQHCLCLWGYLIEQATAAMYHAVAQDKPDYLLVLLGSANLDFARESPDASAARMQPLIAAARAANPDIRVVLGKVPENQNDLDKPAVARQDATFNADLARDGQAWSTPQSPIVVIDTGLDPAGDLYDNSHPNSHGEVKIAAAFVDALAADFSVGVPFPFPMPSPPLGPQQAPELTAKGSKGSATLTWTASPGAWDYVVCAHNVTTGANFCPDTSHPTRYTAKLKPGTYLFAVWPEKGSRTVGDAHPARGKMSNTVTVTVR
ncbi:MAG TPA: hypothetical protein VFB06_20455 [Streptosporangiaceae bacterium]|nr:hypothetical protein [Streptosporangiaceae bacterium]